MSHHTWNRHKYNSKILYPNMMLYADDLSLFTWCFQTKTKKEWWKTHACPLHQKQDSCELLQVSKTQAMSVFMHVTKKKRPCFVMFTNHGSIWWFKTWDFLVCCRTRDQTGQITRTSSNQKVCHLVPTRTRQDHTKWWIKIHSEQNQSSLPGGPRAVFFSAKGRKPKTWFKYPTFSCVRIIKDLHHFQGYAYSKNTAVDRQCNMFSLATCQLGQWT